MSQNEYDATVAAFVRNNGIARCPTACALPTQARAADRAALEDYAAQRKWLRERRMAPWRRSFRTYGVSPLPGE